MGQPEFRYPGLESSLESLEWLWDNHFAAVAGDNPGFEAWSVYYPPHSSASEDSLTPEFSSPLTIYRCRTG